MTYDIGVFTRRRIISPAESYFAVPTAVGGAYSGPGDIVSGALFWVGLRAYSSAAIGQNAVTLVFNDTTSITYATIAGGGLPIATITADSVTHGTPIRISTLYDQTGNGKHFTGTGGNRPFFTLSGLGSFPVITNVYATTTGMANSAGVTASTPFCFSWAVYNTFASGILGIMVNDNVSCNAAYNVGSAANLISLYNGAANPSATVSDNVFHSVHTMFGNPASTSIIQIDATPTTVNTGSTTAFASAHEIGLMATTSGGVPSSDWLDGKLLEFGMWGSDVSSNFTAIAAQQKAYWGY